MAVDEVLLKQVENDESPPVVRLYGFSPPTLSVGRFQRIKDEIIFNRLKQDKITLVRRPTGGQAVLHHKELTYAVILGKDCIVPFRKREIYRFIASLLLEGLKNLGILGFSNRNRKGSLHNPDCFRSTGEYEISGTSEKKLIGSAQIMTRTASLQHGSIPLDDSYKKISFYFNQKSNNRQMEGSSIQEELKAEISFTEAQDAFSRSFKSSLKTESADLSSKERQMVKELYRSKYMEDEWNLMY